MFGCAVIGDVGTEAGSVIAEHGGFPVKEASFRHKMECLRNIQQRYLTLLKMCRERGILNTQTFKELIPTIAVEHWQRNLLFRQ